MRELLSGLFSYPFIQRALVAGTLVALCSALLGVSLVLKRYSMIGDGLSHVGFGAMAVAMAVGAAPLAVALPVVVLAAILTMTAGDVKLAAGLSFAVLLLFLLLYHRIFAVTFDETFARATGIRANLYNMVLALLTAVTIVIGMRLMGTLLISSLIIFPALSAMRVCRSFLGVTLGAAVLSVVCFWVGVIASFLLSTPTGASVVLVDLLVFLLLSLYGLLRRRTRK